MGINKSSLGMVILLFLANGNCPAGRKLTSDPQISPNTERPKQFLEAMRLGRRGRLGGRDRSLFIVVFVRKHPNFFAAIACTKPNALLSRSVFSRLPASGRAFLPGVRIMPLCFWGSRHGSVINEPDSIATFYY